MPLLAGALGTVPDVSIGHALVQMVLALGVIVGGILLLSRILARVRSGPVLARAHRRDAAAGLTVLSRQPLGKDLSLAAVRWGEREVLVGIAGSTITFLGDAAALAPGPGGLAQQPASAGPPSPGAARALRPVAPGGVAPLPPQRTAQGGGPASWLEALRDATLRH